MRIRITIPPDVDIINPDDDRPVTNGMIVMQRIANGEVGLEPMTGPEANIVATANYAGFVRKATDYLLPRTKDYLGVVELRTKLTQEVGSVVEIETETESYRELSDLMMNPQPFLPEKALVSSMLTYHPYATSLQQEA